MISGTFYTVGEAAKLLNKDRKTLWRWMQQGRIRGTKLGNIMLIAKEDVDEALGQDAEATFSTENPSVPEVGTFSTKSDAH